MKDVLKKKIKDLPHTPGVYIFRDSDSNPLYVGKSVDLHNRVRSYFQQNNTLPPKTAQMIDRIDDVEVIHTSSDVEALLLEATVIQALRPKYNTALKDDKKYKYIEITDTQITYSKGKRYKKIKSISHPPYAYPKVKTSRKTNNSSSSYFGPFPKGKIVNEVIRLVRKSFGWCAFKTKQEAENANKPCFYFHLKQCPGFCAGIISYDQYLEHMQRIVRFLSGEKREVLEQLQKNMITASDDQNFEQAKLYRDQIQNLEYILQQFRQAESFITNPVLEEEQFYFARKQLRELLGEINPRWAAWLRNLERIEAYDISNTSGKEATGSMVVLLQGFPDNSQYRRFRIRDLNDPDDFAMMQQVLQRRLSRFNRQSSTDSSFSEVPQLLVIDGGKGQVSSVMKVLSELELDIPTIGLAKREEQIIVPILEDEGTYKTIELPLNSPSLQLLQRIRDEAHRFAKKYHVLLRGKEMMNTEK